MSDYAEIPLTQGFVALVDLDDYERVMAAGKWYANRYRGRVYARTGVTRLHTFLTGWSYVDHRNGDGLDNRKSNLREATNAENQRNRGTPQSNTSGFKGVYREKGRWRAQIGVNGRKLYLGRFDDPEEAARAYDIAAGTHFGEFARLNFPASPSDRSAA